MKQQENEVLHRGHDEQSLASEDKTGSQEAVKPESGAVWTDWRGCKLHSLTHQRAAAYVLSAHRALDGVSPHSCAVRDTR